MPEPKSTLKKNIVGAQVAAARKLLKLTQVDLATATGLTKQTIIKFERGGNVRPETVEAIREALLDRGVVFATEYESGVKLRTTEL